jgi:hypothetical protein
MKPWQALRRGGVSHHASRSPMHPYRPSRYKCGVWWLCECLDRGGVTHDALGQLFQRMGPYTPKARSITT